MTANHFWLARDPDFDEGECSVKFRLTYEGRLEGNGSPKHKHEIRQALHPQLKRLWEVEPNLAGWDTGRRAAPDPVFLYTPMEGQTRRPVYEALGNEFKRGHYRFAPLATEAMILVAGVEILFLRTELPGGVIKSADLDNRLKTLFDALRMPSGESELGGYDQPRDGEDPFFVLLEDDKLLSHVSIETDILLEPTPTAKGAYLANDARLVITVSLKPSRLRLGNMHFT